MRSRVYQVLAWVLRLLLVGFLVERLLEPDWAAAAALSLFLVLSFAYLLRDEHLPNIFDVLVTAAALLNAFGFVFHLYKRIPYYDNVAHALTIFAVTLAFFFLVYRSVSATSRAPVMALSVFTFGVTIGALWEIAEWSAELILDTNVVFGLRDTMTDLVTNSVAALVAAFVALVVRNRSSRLTPAGRD